MGLGNGNVVMNESLFEEYPPYRRIICVKTIMSIEESKSQSSRGPSGTFKTNFLTYIRSGSLDVFEYCINNTSLDCLLYVNLKSQVE